MKPRAFVVMPFGQKPIGAEARSKGRTINFDLVYSQLLKPALEQGGYEVVRADSEAAAGDIRTDMFFELVTADLVVADISIVNGNVFYELGVRHGVSPRGVFTVIGTLNGIVVASRPFDVVPDRSFSYDASPFLEFNLNVATISADKADAHFQIPREHLAKRFKDAIASDRETIGSPVYSHLPGLKPVNWDSIETSKAKYFTALQSDWLDLVRSAQARGHPGDILTLAVNAPTRLHESRILYEAAKALIDLSRYSTAERVLRDVIRLDPDHTDAQVQLALVLCHLDDVASAEHQLRNLLRDYKDRPEAADLLGQVLRHLWHLSWQGKPHVVDRARDASSFAISAVQSFLKAHRADPKAYFAGFNALMLTHVLKEIGVPDQHLTSSEFEELKALTRYVARNQQQQAIEDGNYEQQFWSTTTLAGILFIDQDYEAATASIREACAIPAATSFQLQSFRARLELLAELGVSSKFVARALHDVRKAIGGRNTRCECKRVFLFAGYSIDLRRFPAHRLEAVTKAIENALVNEWGVKAGDLGICGGTSESDIIFAEICLKQGARVRIMLREPIGRESSEPLWPFTSPEWHQRFHRLLLPGEQKDIWLDTKHLGNIVEGHLGEEPERFASRRHNQWLINTAEMEAEPVTDVEKQAGTVLQPSSERLYGLFLWDGRTVDDSSELIRRVYAFHGYQGGQVKTINPVEA